MPFYIASGKDVRAECSVKVFAHSDEEAFALAKEKIPVVAGLERIDAEGSFVPVHHLPLDSMQTEVVSSNEARREQGRKVARGDKVRRAILVMIVLVIVVGLFEYSTWKVKALRETGLPVPRPRAAPPQE